MLPDGPMIEPHRVILAGEDDFDGWRSAARDLAEARVPASAVVWQVEGGEADLFGGSSTLVGHSAGFTVPRRFVELAEDAICHSDRQRFALLYAMLPKLLDNRGANEDRADALVDRIEGLAKEVRRDVHKMHAFVRFRELREEDGEPRFVAFFEPEHHIVRRAAGFFVRRFGTMRWSILTPELSIHWDKAQLTEGPGAMRGEAPAGDPVEAMWKTYYASIFNPARVKVKAMTKEMPRKYWHNLPETELIGSLIAGAQKREATMIETSRQSIPAGGNVGQAWATLRDEAGRCTRCDLYRCATQTVFGEGPLDSTILFVGEQPGDQEDLAGRPFVGPAGMLFDAALAEAGIDRAKTYVTNAVKHFKFVARGKKRIHSKPDTGEIEACRWWLDQERALLRPPLTVALGATAARSLLGKAVTIGKLRGAPLSLGDGSECWVTVHPSFLLRLPDAAARITERARFVDDLKRIRDRANELAA